MRLIYHVLSLNDSVGFFTRFPLGGGGLSEQIISHLQVIYFTALLREHTYDRQAAGMKKEKNEVIMSSGLKANCMFALTLSNVHSQETRDQETVLHAPLPFTACTHSNEITSADIYRPG